MARKPQRRAPARSSRAGGAYRARSRTGSRRVTRRSGGSRSRSAGQQTLKLVIEYAPAAGVARPDGVPQVEAGKSKKAKF